MAYCVKCPQYSIWLEVLYNFLRFLEKRPLTVTFSKFCSKSFHRLTNRRFVALEAVCVAYSAI